MARFGRHVRIGRRIRKDWGRGDQSVLSRAVAYWDARFYGGSGDLLDLTGRGHDAQLGSTAGADANDPLFLPHTGTNYLSLPGTAGNYVSTPDHARLDITSSIDVRAKLSMPDWTPAGSMTVIGKSQVVGQISFRMFVVSNGTIFYVASVDGTANTYIANSTEATGFTDGTTHWIKVTHNTTTGDIKFYTSENGTDWTQLGDTISQGSGAIFSGTSIIEIGSRFAGTDALLAASIYRAQIYDGIDGTLVFDYNPQISFTVDQANAAVITTNRSASGAKSVEVTRPGFLLFTDDYFEIADHADLDFALNQSFTIVFLGKMYGTGTEEALLVKRSNFGATPGYALIDNSGDTAVRFDMRGGSASSIDNTPALTAGDLSLIVGRRDVAADEIEALLNGVSAGTPVTDASTDTLANALPLRIGASSAGTPVKFLNGEFYGAAVFREALSDADILALNAEFSL